MSDPSVGVVLPAYRADIDRLNKYIAEIRDELSPEKIIVEYDEPEDIENLDKSVILEGFKERRGKGAAIRHGFNLLETDIFVFADSDGSVPSNALKNIIEPIRAEEADLSIGSRRHPDAESIRHRTYIRKVLGDILARAARVALEPEIYDYQCGAKAISRDAWQEVEGSLSKNGFGFDLEFVAQSKNHGFQTAEIPIEWEDKPGSTVSVVKDSLRIGKVLLELHVRRYRGYSFFCKSAREKL